DAANHAIDNGLFILGKNVRTRKPDDDPMRCARCQSYEGHRAHDCKAPANVCTRCAADHMTVHCHAAQQDFRCGNCQVGGHTAASRHCPAFLKAQERKRARDRTAAYRYFPTDDPRTW
ncbi:hypothetical protein K438DRAFT_1463343, partial [Mycena galopus ATCC 62051]